MQKIGHLIKQAQHALRIMMDSALGTIEVTLPQYVALSQLSQSAGISNAELARRAFITPQTMHRIVRGLEERGLLMRSTHPQLERIQPLTLTQAGAEKLAQADAIVEQVEQISLTLLDDGEIEQFRVLLAKYLASMAEAR